MTIYLTGNRNCGNSYKSADRCLKNFRNKVVNASSIEKRLCGIDQEIVRKILNLLIEESDAVYMLSGWQASEEAKQDFIHAAAIKKNILFEDFKDEELCRG